MCHQGAYRVDLHCIGICDVMYVTSMAPEEVPGFMDVKIDEISRLLGSRPTPPSFLESIGNWLVSL